MKVKTTQWKMMTATAMCAAAFFASTAHAASGDALIAGARLCTQQFPLQEQQNNIPTHLLAAIATTESGRYHEGLGMSVPWPWTINVEGKGYYFDSKAEAIAQTRNLMAQGRESIDVGCMQVNLKHHPKAFASLEQAFDPVTNVAYAAKFLRENYASDRDWIKATAAYHSRTAVHGQRYLVDIERNWNRIVAKVAAARSGAGKAGEVQVASAPRGASTMAVTAANPRVVNTLKPTTAAAAPSRSARVIKVRDELRRSSEVMVVRATAAPVEQASIKVAEAEPVAASDTMPVGNSVRRVSLDNTATTGVATSTNPQFVFAN